MRNGKIKYVLIKKGNCACDNGKNRNDQKIYVSMENMSVNDQCLSGKFSDSS